MPQPTQNETSTLDLLSIRLMKELVRWNDTISQSKNFKLMELYADTAKSCLERFPTVWGVDEVAARKAAYEIEHNLACLKTLYDAIMTHTVPQFEEACR